MLINRPMLVSAGSLALVFTACGGERNGAQMELDTGTVAEHSLESCVGKADLTKCGDPVGPFEEGDCEFDNACSLVGSQTWRKIIYVCMSGLCQDWSNYSEETCGSRDTDGIQCADNVCSEYCDQETYSHQCDNRANLVRSCHDKFCSSGSCEPDWSTQTKTTIAVNADECDRNTDYADCYVGCGVSTVGTCLNGQCYCDGLP